MTGKALIIPTTVEHIRLLIADLRDDDRREITAFGRSPFKGIWREYKKSKVCRSGFVNGRLVAIWGIHGGLLGFVGSPWLMTTNVADEYPFVFARIYRQEMREMLKSYRVLETFVDFCYDKSRRMMRIVGFKEREFVPSVKDGALLVRMEMTA